VYLWLAHEANGLECSRCVHQGHFHLLVTDWRRKRIKANIRSYWIYPLLEYYSSRSIKIDASWNYTCKLKATRHGRTKVKCLTLEKKSGFDIRENRVGIWKWVLFLLAHSCLKQNWMVCMVIPKVCDRCWALGRIFIIVLNFVLLATWRPNHTKVESGMYSIILVHADCTRNVQIDSDAWDAAGLLT